MSNSFIRKSEIFIENYNRHIQLILLVLTIILSSVLNVIKEYDAINSVLLCSILTEIVLLQLKDSITQRKINEIRKATVRHDVYSNVCDYLAMAKNDIEIFALAPNGLFSKDDVIKVLSDQLSKGIHLKILIVSPNQFTNNSNLYFGIPQAKTIETYQNAFFEKLKTSNLLSSYKEKIEIKEIDAVMPNSFIGIDVNKESDFSSIKCTYYRFACKDNSHNIVYFYSKQFDYAYYSEMKDSMDRSWEIATPYIFAD